MCSHSTNKFNRRLCLLAKTAGAAVLLLLIAGYLEFLFYAQTSNMEWAGECDDAYLLFDGGNLSNARFVFIAHTSFGERMLEEFQQAQTQLDRSLVFKKGERFLAIAVNTGALHQKPYLDYYALIHLRVLAGIRRSRDFILPQQ